MDTMLICWVIVLFGVSIGSSLPTPKESATKNDTSPFGSNDTPQTFKLKRQLDAFDFDTSSFDAPIFPSKIDGLATFSEDDVSAGDLSAFIPAASFKVTRSNSDSLGNHGQNFETTNFPPNANFRADTQNSQQQQQQSGEQQNAAYSNEDQDALSQVSQTNTAFSNQVTTPYYDGFANQPKAYVTAKSSTFPSEATYKTPAKVQFNTYPTITEFTSSIPLYPIPLQPAATSTYHQIQHSASQNNAFKTPLVQHLKNVQANSRYAPVHRHDQSQQAQQFENQFRNFGQSAYDIQYTTTPAVEINGKKVALPIFQLQTQDLPGYIQALETTPVIFGAESGIQYKTEPTFGLYDFSKPKAPTINQRSGTNSPFLTSPNPASLQVLPVQTASSTAQFPKYKGASVEQYPSRGFSKIPNDYQEFKSQSQLHFNGNQNNKPKNHHSHKPAFHPKPLEEIRTDVEVINKKKPIPPLPKRDDDEEESADDDSGEGYKSSDSYFPKNDDDDVELPAKKYFKETELEGDFKPSKSFPFKEFSKPQNIKLDIEDDEDDTDVNLAAKYRFPLKAEDEEEGDDEEDSAEEKPQGKFKSYPLSDSFHRAHDDEDEDEEETRKSERREKSAASDSNHRQSSSRKSKPSKERGKSYEEEFEESFRNKHSKPKFTHSRSKSSSEAPETKARSHSSGYRKEETTPKSAKKARHRSYRDETGEPTGRPLPSFLGSTRFDTKSSENISQSPLSSKGRSTKIPKVIWESSYASTDDSTEEDTKRPNFSREETSVTRKPSSKTIPEFTTRSSPRSTSTKQLSDEPGSSTYSPHSSSTWKTGQIKTKPSHGDSFRRPTGSPVRSLVHDKQSFFNPEFGRGEIFRNLKGI